MTPIVIAAHSSRPIEFFSLTSKPEALAPVQRASEIVIPIVRSSLHCLGRTGAAA